MDRRGAWKFGERSFFPGESSLDLHNAPPAVWRCHISTIWWGLARRRNTRVPYQPDGSYFSMIPQQRGFPDDYPDMKRFRIGSFATFNIGNDPQAALQRIKEYIANGQAVASSGFVLCGYGTNLPMQVADLRDVIHYWGERAGGTWPVGLRVR